MLITNNYAQVVEQIKANIPPKNTTLKHVAQFVSETDIRKIVDIIENRKLLRSLYEETEYLSKNSAVRLLKVALPLLYPNEDIIQYFYDVLLSFTCSKEHWIAPIKNDDFIRICGINYIYKRNYEGDDLYLHKLYDIAFEKRILCDPFPPCVKELTIKHIASRETLTDVVNMVESTYKTSYCENFQIYLDKYILPVIGDEVLASYIHDMIEKYKSSLPHESICTMNNSMVLQYIFGNEFSFGNRLYNNKRNNLSNYVNVYKIILKTILPYVIQGYGSYSYRNRVYKILELNTEECVELENIVKSYDRQGYNDYDTASLYNANDVEACGIKSTAFFDAMDSYMKEIISKDRLIPRYATFCKALAQKTSDEIICNVLNHIGYYKKLNILLHSHYNELALKAKEAMFNGNKKELNSGKDTIVLYIKNGDNYSNTTIDLSDISNDWKDIIVSYIDYNLYELCSKANKLNSITSRLIRFLSFVINKYGCKNYDDIEEWHTLSYLHHLDVNRHLNPQSMSKILTRINKIYDYIRLHIDMNVDNPAKNILITNIRDHIIPTDVIPDDILVFLDKHIGEIKQKDVELIYRILNETAWRFSDIRNIKVSDVENDLEDSHSAIIRVRTSKTKRSRIINRLGDVLEDRISIDLFNDIMKYIDDTKYIREKYKIDTLFFRIVNGALTPLKASQYNKNINTFLQINSIKSIDETYYNFTSRQSRKTTAVSLISDGASLSSVQKKLGHTNPSTTAVYYAHVQKKHLAELNHEFYQEKFNVLFDEEKLKLFTEEERRILYVDFCLGHRDVELGLCSKHPSEGRCITIGQTSCARCPKLCTGRKYLDKWQRLVTASKTLLDEFVAKYEAYGIKEEDYKNYIEYKQEKMLYDNYMAVISAIKKG